MASTRRTRSCTRCLALAILVLAFLFFSSLLYLSTRRSILDIAVREEVSAGRLRLVVDRAAAAGEANASVTADAVTAQASDIAAVANEAGGGTASGDANVRAVREQVSAGIASVAAADGDAKVVTDAPPASNAAAADDKLRTEEPTVSDAAATGGSGTADGEADTDAVVFDFRPYVLVYKSGRVHRFHGTDTVPPGVDAPTGVASVFIFLFLLDCWYYLEKK